MKERFLTLEKNNINGRGEFVITSSEERFQDKNRAIALRKLQEKVDRACAEPKKRKLKTGGELPSLFPVDVDPLVKKKWVEDKRRRSELKQKRKGKEGGIEHFSPICSNKQATSSVSNIPQNSTPDQSYHWVN